MSAPSNLHENRRMLLGEMATLAGYTIELRFAVNQRPDVVRFHPLKLSLLVGDAKATESPGCEETRRRVAGYLRTARRWQRAGFDIRVALCHPPDPDSRWASLLASAAADVRAVALPGGVTTIDDRTSVTWIRVTSANVDDVV